MWLACERWSSYWHNETMSVEPVTWQDEYSGQQFSYASEKTSMILPPLTSHVSRVDDHSRRQVAKLPEWSRYSESELSSRLLNNREMSLPELNRRPQMMTSRRLPLARGAAAAAATARCAEDAWMKNWSSELPAHDRRSWRQSTDSVSQAQSGLAMMPGTSKTDYLPPSADTALWRSSSTKVLLTDTSVSLKPTIARKPSLSMDNLTDKRFLVIISLTFKIK